MGGLAQLFRVAASAGEEQVIAAINTARDEQYAEIVSRCKDFRAEIERESATHHFTYAELEENEEGLVKLRGWLAKVRSQPRCGVWRSCKTALKLRRAGLCPRLLPEE